MWSRPLKSQCAWAGARWGAAVRLRIDQGIISQCYVRSFLHLSDLQGSLGVLVVLTPWLISLPPSLPDGPSEHLQPLTVSGIICLLADWAAPPLCTKAGGRSASAWLGSVPSLRQVRQAFRRLARAVPLAAGLPLSPQFGSFPRPQTPPHPGSQMLPSTSCEQSPIGQEKNKPQL